MSLPPMRVPELETRYAGDHYGSTQKEPLISASTCLDLLELYPPGTLDRTLSESDRVLYKTALGHNEVVEHFQQVGQHSFLRALATKQ